MHEIKARVTRSADKVKEMDVDVIVGPSRGFVWAEDPARELRADVPEKGGRDIALAGGIFLIVRKREPAKD